MSHPVSTRDLLSSERAFVAAMSGLHFGRFEYLRIEHGEIVLDPWPTAVRDVKFGSHDPNMGLPFMLTRLALNIPGIALIAYFTNKTLSQSEKAKIRTKAESMA